MSLAPCISEHERAQMERTEKASMHGYPRLGPPFNAYFQSYERAVYRLHTEGGELVAYAIVDTSRPRLLVMRIHELHVEQAWRRQTHATRLVHAIEDGAPVNSSLEVHVHAANSIALSFYAAFSCTLHARTDDGVLVLQHQKPEGRPQAVPTPSPAVWRRAQGVKTALAARSACRTWDSLTSRSFSKAQGSVCEEAALACRKV